MMNNIPEIKMGIISVSRGCFPIALSEKRRANVVKAYGDGLYECPICVETELDARRAVDDVKAQGVNALVVFLGNFGPETPETMIADWFTGPILYTSAAEGDGDLHDGRGDAYCGMLNASYNLGLRGKRVYIPDYPCGTAQEVAQQIRDAGTTEVHDQTPEERAAWVKALEPVYAEMESRIGKESIDTVRDATQ